MAVIRAAIMWAGAVCLTGAAALADEPPKQEPKQPATPTAPATPSKPAEADTFVLPGSAPDAEGAPASKPQPTAAAPADAFVIPENPRFPTANLVKAKVEKKPDGTLLIDGKYTITGEGTKAKPYKVPWDLIVSAQDTYRPRKGQTKLPQRVVMLDGKWVEISGYIAFPITAATPKEALVMLNQWDGCCIGTPPTAYDAIEAHLGEPALAAQRMAVHGVISGVFKVDPYEDSGWLLGLYVIEDARLTTDQ